jgi:hypothetical protein
MIRQAPRVAFDFHPVWSPDGAELFYVAIAGGSGGQLAAVRVEPGMTFGSPQRLPGAVAGGRQAGLTRAFDVLPDGRFVGLVSGSAEDISAESASPEIRVVQNWTEELKRLVPTN